MQVFSHESSEYPLYLIYNSIDTIRVKQRSAPPATTFRIPASSRSVFSWPEPTLPHVIEVTLPNSASHSDAILVDMDALGSRLVAGKVQLEVVAVGPTRMLRVSAISDKSVATNWSKYSLAGAGREGWAAAAAAVSGQMGAIRWVVKLRMGGVGISVIDSCADEILYSSFGGLRCEYIVSCSDWSIQVPKSVLISVCSVEIDYYLFSLKGFNVFQVVAGSLQVSFSLLCSLVMV